MIWIIEFRSYIDSKSKKGWWNWPALDSKYSYKMIVKMGVTIRSDWTDEICTSYIVSHHVQFSPLIFFQWHLSFKGERCTTWTVDQSWLHDSNDRMVFINNFVTEVTCLFERTFDPSRLRAFVFFSCNDKSRCPVVNEPNEHNETFPFPPYIVRAVCVREPLAPMTHFTGVYRDFLRLKRRDARS